MTAAADDKDAKTPKASGRYRKVEVRIWGDERFCALSPIPPCGRGLFLYLMTGPHTGPVPGLFRAGRAAMAEELDWSLEAFDEAFQEVFAQGLVKADFKARVVWIPNAIKHNKPESPNVVKSWAAEFDLIPECDLKRVAYEALKASIHALGEPYAKAFNESIGKAFPKSSTKTMPNQEQEQQQQQLKNTPPPPKGGKRVKTPKPDKGDPPGFVEWYTEYRRKDARKDAVKAWLALAPDAALQARMLDALRRWPWRVGPDAHFNPLPASWLRGERWTDIAVGVPKGADVPDWCTAAGFENVHEAANFRCYPHTAHQFKNGQRITEGMTA